jgi:hypothetical protein
MDFGMVEVLLRILKVIGLLWLGILVAGVAVLPALYVFGLAALAIRRRFGRRNGR